MSQDPSCKKQGCQINCATHLSLNMNLEQCFSTGVLRHSSAQLNFIRCVVKSWNTWINSNCFIILVLFLTWVCSLTFLTKLVCHGFKLFEKHWFRGPNQFLCNLTNKNCNGLTKESALRPYFVRPTLDFKDTWTKPATHWVGKENILIIALNN